MLLVQWSFYKWTTLLCFNQLLGGLLIFLFILICRRPWQQRTSLWIASLIMFQLMTACTHPITHHYTRHFIFFTSTMLLHKLLEKLRLLRLFNEVSNNIKNVGKPSLVCSNVLLKNSYHIFFNTKKKNKINKSQIFSFIFIYLGCDCMRCMCFI